MCCLKFSGTPMRSQDSSLVRVPDSWSKGCEFKSRQEWRENLLLQSQLCVLTLIQCHVVQLWHAKYSGHSAKSAGGRFHLNMLTPLTQRSRSGLTVPLFRDEFPDLLDFCNNLSGNCIVLGDMNAHSDSPNNPCTAKLLNSLDMFSFFSSCKWTNAWTWSYSWLGYV